MTEIEGLKWWALGNTIVGTILLIWTSLAIVGYTSRDALCGYVEKTIAEYSDSLLTWENYNSPKVEGFIHHLKIIQETGDCNFNINREN